MRYRSVALPPEHGGWGLLFEPLLVGLAAAPSGAGMVIALAAVAVFLARQPLKIVLTDSRSRRHIPRTNAAAAFAIGYLAAAGVAGAVAFRSAGAALVVPIACALPLGLVQVVYDARNRSRGPLPEVCGASALAASAAAVAITAGWDAGQAMALSGVAAARTVPAMVTVRTQVLRLHGQPASAAAPAVSHALALALVAILARAELLSFAPLAVLLALAIRAAVNLRPSAPRVRAQRIGLEELVVGLGASLLLGGAARP